jgi:hypothetical protein
MFPFLKERRMKYVLALMAMLALSFTGCRYIQISPEAAAAGAERGAAVVTTLGLKTLSTDAAACTRLKGYATEAKAIITTSVLPFITGSSVTEVSVATVNFALDFLDGKVNPALKAVLQTAIDSALVLIGLPENPADKLSDDQRMIIVALFNGINTGINNFVKWDGPAAKSVSKAMPDAGANHLGWKYGGND